MKKNALMLAWGLLLIAAPVYATGWTKIDDSEGVAVYRKDVAGSDLVAFRGETVIDAPLDKLLWVLANNEHRTEWVDRLEESVVLERYSAWDFVVYQHFGLPAILSDRDYVYRAAAVRLADGTVVLHMASCEHPEAPETVGVRAQLIGSSYVLAPLGPDKTRVSVEIHTDPKGSIPTWLVNLIQASWPEKTLNGIRAQVGKPFVKAYPLPPVLGTPASVQAGFGG